MTGRNRRSLGRSPASGREHVAPGITLAKVVQPDQLKASLKIAETQAREIQISQPAEVDTHNGIIAGKVSRIDPAVQNGTVTVDVELQGALPQGARPDLSVDGTIDLNRLGNVVFVGRPAFGNENSTISLFRVSPDGKTATRVPVKSWPRFSQQHPGPRWLETRRHRHSVGHVPMGLQRPRTP